MATVADTKQLEITDTPLILFDCELVNGEYSYWSTHTVSIDGKNYAARVLQHNSFDLRASMDEAADGVSRLSLTLANADSYFSELEETTGWKGALLTGRFVFVDLKQGQATSESLVVFRGVASAPEEMTESTCRLAFSNRLTLQRLQLPDVRIQKRCPWAFPQTAEQRQLSLDGGERGKYSPFYKCGYTPDLTGGVGNLSGGASFASCGYTRAQCEERGMFSGDSSSRQTRRFGGVEFVPSTITVRSYGEKGTHLSPVVENLTRYNECVPILYGTGWYNPPIIFARNDGNLTHTEVLLGVGEMAGVITILVNDVIIPLGQAGTDMTATGWYNIVSLGARTGGFNLDFIDASGNPLGDPYGSMAVLSVVVPNRISDGQSLPTVQVLAQGLKLPICDASGAYQGEVFTNNPAWVLLDILHRSGWKDDELNLGSFASTAAYCGAALDTVDGNGQAVTIPRFGCNLILRNRRSAADLIRGVRNGAGLYLRYGQDGKLEVRPETTLENQQSVKPAGSNSQEALDQGWPAYEFGDGTEGVTDILVRASGESSLKISSKNSADAPNRYSIEFQDEMNEYQQDSLSLVDIDDSMRTGQENSASLMALGIPNFDQAARVLRLQIDKSVRGNLFVDFDTSVRGVELLPGDLITMTYARHGLQRQPFRITRITPSLNYRTMHITAQAHSDDWYGGTEGVAGSGGRQPTFTTQTPRPVAGTHLDSDGNPQYDVSEVSAADTDGAASVSLVVGFTAPTQPSASFTRTPLVSLTPQVDEQGGTLAGGRSLYYAVTAVNGSGGESDTSFVIRADIPGATNTNQVTLTGLSFPPGSVSFDVYRGETPVNIRRVATGLSISTTYTDSGAAAGTTAPPDKDFDHANAYWRFEVLPPVSATIHSAGTIGNDSLRMQSDEHKGRVARIISGRGAGQERTITGNRATTVSVGPVWTIEPDATSSFTIAEAGWHLGASTQSSPVEFEIPNRMGVYVQIQIRSANVFGGECSPDLSPITRWCVQGAAGSWGSADQDVPGQPAFSVAAHGAGMLEVSTIGFTDPTKAAGVTSATFSAYYVSEVDGVTAGSLTDPIDSSATALALGAGAVAGSLVLLENELVQVIGVDNGTSTVVRGAFGTTAASHAAGCSVRVLERQVLVMPFPREFFGSPASGSYSNSMYLPDVKVVAAELYATNGKGDSTHQQVNYLQMPNSGIRTLAGGQLSLQLEGVLAIQTDAVPPLIVDATRSIRDIVANVRRAPAGGDAVIQLRQGQTAVCALTIPNGTTQSSVIDGAGLGALQAGAQLSMDITSVAQGADDEPGRDLTVTIRL